MNAYIHAKETYRNDILKKLVSILPLLIYAVYKNGYLLYQKDLVSLAMVFKPLYLMGIAFVMAMIIEFLFNKKLKITDNVWCAVVASLFIMPNIDLLIYVACLAIGLILSHIISQKLIFNKMAFLKLFIVLLCLVVHRYSYMNLWEANAEFSLGFWDYLFGRGIGGVAATSIIIGIVIYIFWSIFTTYKKIIPVISYLVYVVLMSVYMLVAKDFDFYRLMDANIILPLIMVAPDTFTTPYKLKRIIIYSIFLGIFAFIFSVIINTYEGVFIAILVLSLFNGGLEKIKIKRGKGRSIVKVAE